MPTIQEVAQQYIDAGWAVVPILAGEKRAATKWQSKVYTANDFKTGDNIAGKCGEPSSNRVDADCDSPAAVACARLMLPHTGLTHGRPGKPDSHYWYEIPGIKTTQFTDVKDSAGRAGMILEIRSSGGYTVLPPSIHPSGDVLAWTSERAPLTMTPEDGYAAFRDVAIAALLATHWPGAGVPHAMMGPLAGFLCQAGLVASCVTIIRTASTVAGEPPDDTRDRVNYAQSTIAKFKANPDAKLTGGPKLAEFIGADVVMKLRQWCNLADIDALEEMNEKHAWVRLGANDVILREDDASGVIFQRVKSLYSEYANRTVNTGNDDKGRPQFEPLFPAWLAWPGRRSYTSVVFAPPPLIAQPGEYNLWKGFAIEPKGGARDCIKFLLHIKEVICAGNDVHFKYLMNLVAWTVQNPGLPSEVATVLRGEPGTGKGIFVRALMDLFGHRHAIQLDKTEHLVGHFNGQLSGKVIVFADEAFFAGDKAHIGALKRAITEPWQTIERKGFDAVMERNCMKLFMATNEEWAVPAMLKERRFFALLVSSSKRQDKAYFTAIDQELKSGGLAGFLAMMLERQVTHDEIRDVPKTAELRVQQNQSLAPELKWWNEMLMDEGVQFGSWVTAASLFDSYALWVKAHGLRMLDKSELGRRMSNFWSADKGRAHRFSGRVERGYDLRGLLDARATFDAEIGEPTEWPDPSVGTSVNTNIPF